MPIPDNSTSHEELSSTPRGSIDTITGSSSPRSRADSASPSLVSEVSKLFIASPSTNSQLEQLANTNLLTIRIKQCKDTSRGSQKEAARTLSEIEQIINHYKGFTVGANHIESYEYLPDAKRLGILQENKDIYIFENGSEEFATFSSNDENLVDEPYESVVQAQFKRSNILNSACVKVEQLLKKNEDSIDKWSMSINKRALTQPGNLYIRGIPKHLSMDHVVPIFSEFGPISSLKIICDNTTGESLGYGFISFPLGSQASKCIKKLNGHVMGTSTLFINYHIERKERERIYRDNIKENNNDERFKGIFIGNLPLHNTKDELVTPSDVLQLFKTNLSPQYSDFGIVSYYFPKKNSNTEFEYKDEDDEKIEIELDKNVESCSSQYEESPLKNFGFIKFVNHEQALGAVEMFNNFKWLGNCLVVNRAIQSKTQNVHQRLFNEKSISPSSSGTRSGYHFYTSYGNSAPSNPYRYYNGAESLYFPYVNSRGSMSNPTAGEIGHQDVDPLYTMGRSFSAGTYVSPYHLYGGISSPGTASNSFDVSTSGNPILPMNPYSMMPQDPPFGLPLPTREQQESNLYVKHLPLSWKDEDLLKFYSKFGEIISAKIITVGGSKNRENGKNINADSTSDDSNLAECKQLSLGTSRGYGFVCFKNPLDASNAILSSDGFPLTGTHTLHVSFAQKRAKSFANQGGIAPSSAPSTPTSPMSGSAYFLNSRRLSHNEYLGSHYNLKFLNAMRHHRGASGGNYGTNFAHGGNNWSTLPVMPSVSPALSPIAFVPPTHGPIIGPYMMHQSQLLSNKNEDSVQSTRPVGE